MRLHGRVKPATRQRGSVRSPGKSLEERLWSRIDKRGKRACWLWRGAVTGYGYGCIRVGLRVAVVHRVLYEHLHGPIPPGMTLDHLCGNTLCQNPAHWELVTRAENAARSQRRRKH